MITADYFYIYNSDGGGSPFGSSVSFTPPTGPSSSQVTIAVVFSTRNTTNQTFTPGVGWTVVNTRQQLLSRTPDSTVNEEFAGTNPEYVTITTLVAVGVDGATLTGTFPVGLYYSLSFWRFSGVDLASPIAGHAVTGRSFVGNNSGTPALWTTPFTDAPAVSVRGASILMPYIGIFGIPYASNARYNSSWVSLLATFPTTLPTTSLHAYATTESDYTRGTSLASLVVLRDADAFPGQAMTF